MCDHPLQAYRSCPSVHGRTGQLVFLCEGDIWHQELRRAAPGAALSVSAARRLTAGGECSSPVFSPCGAWLAFAKLSSETGADEVHSCRSRSAHRLTALGADSRVVAWARMAAWRQRNVSCCRRRGRAAAAAAPSVIIFRTDATQARPGRIPIVALLLLLHPANNTLQRPWLAVPPSCDHCLSCSGWGLQQPFSAATKRPREATMAQ